MIHTSFVNNNLLITIGVNPLYLQKPEMLPIQVVFFQQLG